MKIDNLKYNALRKAYAEAVEAGCKSYIGLFHGLNNILSKLGLADKPRGYIHFSLLGKYTFYFYPVGENPEARVMLTDTSKVLLNSNIPEKEYQKLLAYADSAEFRDLAAEKAADRLAELEDLYDDFLDIAEACSDLGA